jgi:hypothetical protein
MKTGRKPRRRFYKTPFWITQRVLDSRGERYYGRATGNHKVKYPTAVGRGGEKIGQQFIESFPKHVLKKRKRVFSIGIGPTKHESYLGLVIHLGSKYRGQKIASVKLGFEKDAVVIESIQGIDKTKKDLDAFKNLAGMPWANYLLQQVEEHARKHGFKYVKIRRPETLDYYGAPMTESAEFQTFDFGSETRAIREDMRKLYYSVAHAMKYKRMFPFFVKEL